MTNEIARETSSSLRGCTQCVAYLDEIGWSTGRKRKPDRVYQEEVDKMDVNYLRDNMVMLICRGIVIIASLIAAVKEIFF